MIGDRLNSKKPDANRVKTIESTIATLDKRYQKDCAKANVVRKEVEKINEEITSIGVARLESVKLRLAATADKIKEVPSCFRVGLC